MPDVSTVSKLLVSRIGLFYFYAYIFLFNIVPLPLITWGWAVPRLPTHKVSECLCCSAYVKPNFARCFVHRDRCFVHRAVIWDTLHRHECGVISGRLGPNSLSSETTPKLVSREVNDSFCIQTCVNMHLQEIFPNISVQVEKLMQAPTVNFLSGDQSCCVEGYKNASSRALSKLPFELGIGSICSW